MKTGINRTIGPCTNSQPNINKKIKLRLFKGKENYKCNNKSHKGGKIRDPIILELTNETFLRPVGHQNRDNFHSRKDFILF